MAIGLSKQELDDLLSFGKSADEIKRQLTSYADESGKFTDASILFLFVEKISTAVTENNKRITEQLVSAGVQIIP